MGEHDINSEIDCDYDKLKGFCLDPVQDIPVVNKISHEHYKKGVRQHDIALLKLQRPAELTKKVVNTICLPTTEQTQLDKLDSHSLSRMSMAGENLTWYFVLNCDFETFYLGWGVTETEKASDVLKAANYKFVSYDECVKRFKPYNQTIYEGNFCSGGTNATDPCRGDSGGPITSEPEFGLKVFQYGLLSGGLKCNQDYGEFFPAVYVDIAFYLEWILNNMSPWN